MNDFNRDTERGFLPDRTRMPCQVVEAGSASGAGDCKHPGALILNPRTHGEEIWNAMKERAAST